MFRKIVSKASSCRYLLNRVTSLSIPLVTGLPLGVVSCEKTEQNYKYDQNALEHEFLIKQASTVNVNAATQLLTVTMVAIQDTSQRLREVLTQEICLVQHALEVGEDKTPPQHWDELISVRATLGDLKHNLTVLLSYLEYVEKVATAAAEISYLSGNTSASDAICERIDHLHRTCNNESQMTHKLQEESWNLQKQVINKSKEKEKEKEEPSTKQQVIDNFL